MRAHEISLAVTQAGAMAAWHGGESQQSSIYVQALDEQGLPAGQPKAVSDGPGMAYEPDIVRTKNGFAVVWYTVDARSGLSSVWIAGLTPQGDKLWHHQIGGKRVNARNPVVRLIGEQLHVAWIEHELPPANPNPPRIVHQVFLTDGAPVGTPKTVGTASVSTWNLNAATYQNQLILAYDAQLGTRAPELQMVVISDGAPVHRTLTSDDGFASLYPDIQVSREGMTALTWFDERDGNQEAYLAVAPYESLVADQPAALRVTHSKGPTFGAYAAWNGNRLGLAWVEDVGGRPDLYAKAFNADGRPLGSAQPVGATLGGDAKGSAGVPAIRAYAGGFLIGWNSYRLRGDAGHNDVISSQAHFALIPLTP